MSIRHTLSRQNIARPCMHYVLVVVGGESDCLKNVWRRLICPKLKLALPNIAGRAYSVKLSLIHANNTEFQCWAYLYTCSSIAFLLCIDNPLWRKCQHLIDSIMSKTFQHSAPYLILCQISYQDDLLWELKVQTYAQL